MNTGCFSESKTSAHRAYELESVRSLVLAVQAGEATSGALRANPGYRPDLAFDPRRLLLWLAIVLAARVLGGLALRLVRSDPDEG